MKRTVRQWPRFRTTSVIWKEENLGGVGLKWQQSVGYGNMKCSFLIWK